MFQLENTIIKSFFYGSVLIQCNLYRLTLFKRIYYTTKILIKLHLAHNDIKFGYYCKMHKHSVYAFLILGKSDVKVTRVLSIFVVVFILVWLIVYSIARFFVITFCLDLLWFPFLFGFIVTFDIICFCKFT